MPPKSFFGRLCLGIKIYLSVCERLVAIGYLDSVKLLFGSLIEHGLERRAVCKSAVLNAFKRCGKNYGDERGAALKGVFLYSLYSLGNSYCFERGALKERHKRNGGHTFTELYLVKELTSLEGCLADARKRTLDVEFYLTAVLEGFVAY